MRILTIYCFILFATLSKLTAQITLEIQDVSTCQNTVSVPIVILEDQILTSIQFTLVWDGRNGTGLSYSGVTDLIGSGNVGLGPMDVTMGPPNQIDTLTYTWNNPSGHSFSAGDELFTLDLDIGTVGEIYPVFFYPGPNPPSPLEATAPGFVIIPVSTIDGAVTSASNSPTFANCPADIIVDNTDGSCANVVNWTPPTVVDCDNNSNPPTSDFSPGNTFSIGTQLVTYSVTDSDGNMGTCTFNVTVTDGAAPVLTCPPNINQTVATGATYTATSAELMPTISDCANNITTSYTLTGDTQDSGTYTGQNLTFNPGTTQVMYSVSDGINPPATCSFDVVINEISGNGITLDIGEVTTTCDEDISVPVIILEDQDITTVEFTIIWGQPGLTFNGLTSNLSGGLVTIGPNPTPPHNDGADTITYSYTNFAAVPLTAGQTLVTLNFTPTGNEGDVIPVLFFPGNTHPEFPVPAEASDAGFNPILPVNTMDGSITIGAPDVFTIDCPADINLVDTDGDCSEIATWNPPTVNDCNNNANPPTSDFDSGDSFGIGSQIVTYTVTDTDGNMATCTFTVNVTDGAAPDLTCPPNINQTVATGATYTATSAELMPTISDCANNTTNSYTLTGDTQDSGTYNGQNLTFNPGTTQVMYSVSDGINPPATCSFEVVINEISGNGITLDIGEVTTTCDEDISVPVIILEDQDITTVEFTIIWGQPGLTFNGLTSNLTGGLVTIGPNPTPPHNDGADTITYSYTNFAAVSLTAGQTLVTLNFTPTGNEGDVIPVLFFPGNSHPEFPVPAEASDAGFNPILPVNTMDGSITIGGSSLVTIECPAAIQISCEDPTTPSNTGMASALDECGNSLTPGFSDVLNLTDCNNTGTITRTFTATDGNGNINSCTQIITITDNIDPLFDTQPAAITNINCGEDLPTQEILTATDNCGNATVTPSVDPFTADPCNGYSITYRWTATDGCGNSTEVTQSFNVNPDNVDPSFAAQPASIGDIDCGQNLPTQETLTATDNCGNATVTPSVDPFTADPCNGYSITYRWTATDGCGNSTEVTQSFNVNPDNTDPSFAAQPASIEDIDCGQNLPTQETLTATDNCGNATVTPSVDPFTADPCNGYSITYRWTATDDCGNSTEVTQSFNVNPDNTVPSFTVPSDIIINCEDDPTNLLITGDVTDEIDNCDPDVSDNGLRNATFSDNIDPGDCSTLIIRSWTLTDQCGNENVQTQSIQQVDTTSPDVVCQQNTDLFLDENGIVTLDPGNLDNGSIDNCSNVLIFSASQEDFTCLDLGSQTVTLTAADGCGNASTCDAAVTIIDNIIPTLTCREDLTLSTTNPSEVINNIALESSDDNCAVSEINYTLSGATTGSGTGDDASGTVFNTGQTLVTYFVTDNSGNTNSCSFTVNLEGAVRIECPDFITLNALTGNCSRLVDNIEISILSDPQDIASISYELTGATTGSGIGDASGTTFNIGTTLVTYTATDNFGNSTACGFSIAIIDAENPTFETNCPQDIVGTIGLDCQEAVTWMVPTVADNCPGVTLNSTHQPGDLFETGETIVTYTATDLAGNSSTCTFSISLADDTAPSINCPDPILTDSPDGNPVIVNDIAPLSSDDNCPNPVITFTLTGALSGSGSGDASGTEFPVGQTTVNYLITDASGLSANCSFTITIQGAINITCPENMTSDTDINCTQIVENIGISINSDPTVITSTTYELTGATTGTGSDDASGTSFNLGITTVTYTVIDNLNNMVVCSFMITIIDNTDPTISCPENIVRNTTNGTPVTISNIGPITTDDNCFAGDITYTLAGATTGSGMNDASGNSFSVGETTVTYTVVDLAGNEASCDFIITINDEIINEDLIDCPADMILDVDAGLCSNTISEIAAILLIDPMDLQSLTWGLNGATVGNGSDLIENIAFNVNLTEVTFTATSNSGNTDFCSFMVIVNDNNAPVITGPAAFDFSSDSDECGTVPEFNINVTDNCEVEEITYEFTGALNESGTGIPADIFIPTGITNLIITATDIRGNSETYTTVISITDEIDPIATCPEDLTISVDPGGCQATLPDLEGMKFDNCAVANDLYQISGATTATDLESLEGIALNVGDHLINFEIIDVHGNTDACSFNILVVDDQAPIIECPEDIFINLPMGQSSVAIENIDPINATDLCTDFGISYTITGATTDNGTVSASGTNFNIGTSEVTYTITDAPGNENTCTFSVFIGNLNIDCPENQEVIIPMNACEVIVNDLTPSTANSNTNITYEISGATTGSGSEDASGTAFNSGISTVTYTLVDDFNNQAFCSFTITALDQQAPVLTCPDLPVFSTDPESCSAFIPMQVLQPMMSQDNCDPSLMVEFEITGSLVGSGNISNLPLAYPTGIALIVYTVTDQSGNSATCSFNLEVADDSPPAIMCPDDIQLTVPAGVTSAQVDNTAPTVTDNCGVNQVSYDLSGATTGTGINNVNDVDFQIGTTVVTYTTTDLSGNSISCFFNVTITQEEVIDLINCPIDQVTSTNPGSCSFTLEDIAPDLLVPGNEIQSITYVITGSTELSGSDDASGTTFNAGISTVTYIATSISQENQTICSFTVTILDQENPFWTGCPLNITVNANEDNCMTAVTWDEPVAVDNCGTVHIDREIEPGADFAIGTTTFNYIATDEVGNSSNCEINVTVFDNTPPVSQDCPTDITITTDTDNCGALYNFDSPTFTDNCSPVMVTNSHQSGDLFPVGMTTVTFTATDESQNTSTCEFTITVIDQTPPVLTCTEDVVINGDGTISSDPSNIIQSIMPTEDCESAIVIFNDPVAMDNCSNVIINTVGPGSGDIFSGTTTITFQAIDEEGNESLSCSFTVTVLALPNISVMVNPPSACAGSTVTLSAEPITGASYLWEGPNGFTATGNSIFVEDISTEAIGVYQVEVTLSGDCIVVETGAITLAQTPVITDLISNGPICVGEDINLSVTGNNLDMFLWSGPNNFSSTSPNPLIENATEDLSGNYTVTISSAEGCTTSQTIPVEINGVPSLPSIQTDCESFICLNESCLLIGTAYPSGAIYIWESDDVNAGIPANINNNELVITPLAAGTYTYQYSVDINGCVSPPVQYTLTVDAGPVAVDDFVQVDYQGTLENITVLANDIVTPGLGMSVNLLRIPEHGNVLQNGDNTFSYTPNLDFIGLDEFTYQICYVCSGELVCDEGVVSVNIAYTGDCDVPNVITPNGDNKNDVLFLPCITGDEFPDNQLAIYNQWGDEVFRQAPYQNQWDGTLNGETGKDLPDGTYFFIFITDQNSNPIKGHITIYR